MVTPRFFYTVHPGDLLRERLLEGAPLMAVASAWWDAALFRLRVRRPPATHTGPLALDSGGFTAARRWGRYPWTPAQYVDWARAMGRDHELAFVAGMDYACERAVNRRALATNLERIRASLGHELALRRLAPDLPWLGVLQGNTLAERAHDVRFRARLGLIRPLMGVGSICGRTATEARAVLRFYMALLPGVRFHALGLDVRTLDRADDVWARLASWDSYGWTWGRGQKDVDRPAELYRQAGESYSRLVRRLAEFYADRVIAPRLTQPRQTMMEGL